MRRPLPRPTAPRAPVGLQAGYFAPVLVRYFADLPVMCSLVWWKRSGLWNVLTPSLETPGVLEFEISHPSRSLPPRQKYNNAHREKSTRSREIVVGEFGGFSDFFVPIVERGTVTAHLVCGPFRPVELTAAEIRSRYVRCWGEPSDRSDASLLEYARRSLRTVLLTGDLYAACLELLRTLSVVMGGAEDPDVLVDRFVRESAPALQAASPAMWRTAKEMVDPGWSSTWRHPKMGWMLRAMGVKHMFTHVISLAFDERADEVVDPVERLVRAHDLQRFGSELARRLTDTVAGQLGDYGVFFLTSCEAGARDEHSIEERVAKIRDRIRARFGVRAVAGVSNATADGEALPRCYDESVLALEYALHEKRLVVSYREQAERASGSAVATYRSKATELRHAVVAGASEAAEVAAHALTRAVMWRARGSLEMMRAYFDSMVVELLEAVAEHADLDARSVRVLERSTGLALDQARTASALSAAFQRTSIYLAQVATRPAAASRDARLEGARRYVEANLRSAIRLSDVARESGLSPRYFSSLFKKRWRTGFKQYLWSRRLERARELLLTTKWPLARLSRDVGFGSEAHFCRAFKRAYRLTPSECRAGRKAGRLLERRHEPGRDLGSPDGPRRDLGRRAVRRRW